MIRNKIVVVLVTYNRLEKLKRALECYEKQTYPLQEVLVVDNCSTDGTDLFLAEWGVQKSEFKRKWISLSENMGGAGGFAAGMEEVLQQQKQKYINADWILVSDDDAFPEDDAVEKLIRVYEQLPRKEQNSVVVLSSAVLNHGKYDLGHRCRIQKSFLRVRFTSVNEKEYDNPFFKMDIFTYVGVMIRLDVLAQAGPANKDYFIYCDDHEHSLRLRKYGEFICVPTSVFHHDRTSIKDRKITWYNYYDRRNSLYIIKMFFPQKRYLLFRLIKRYILDISPISKRNKEERELFKAAQKDVVNGRLGEHPVYKPGFQISQEDNKL